MTQWLLREPNPGPKIGPNPQPRIYADAKVGIIRGAAIVVVLFASVIVYAIFGRLWEKFRPSAKPPT